MSWINAISKLLTVYNKAATAQAAKKRKESLDLTVELKKERLEEIRRKKAKSR